MRITEYKRKLDHARIKLDHTGYPCVTIRMEDSFVVNGKTHYDNKLIRHDLYHTKMNPEIVKAFWDEVERVVVEEE